jgi:hypothetical protein
MYIGGKLMSSLLASTRNRMIAVGAVIAAAIVVTIMVMVNWKTKLEENMEEQSEKQPIIQFTRRSRRKVS